ncbi:DUF1367 family protein [Salmonella enterica]|nr:DUF1367 family protein [Salmonella enterica subsp. enterica]EDT6983904.1 DUF1367 family protein [Salmonella enterica subsp. arizonae]EED2758921.1 DUF1367 family protein [Salmonella enterica]
MHIQLVKHTSSGRLLPATPESGESLHSSFSLFGGDA